MPRYRDSHWLNVDLANGHYAAGGHGHFSSSSSSTTATTAVPPLCLNSKDSTRVQILKQKLDEQQHAIVLEQSIPGYRTSAAFFASLRTNLRLNASPPPSPMSTPPSMRASTGTLPPPSPLATPAYLMDTNPENPPDDVSVPNDDPLANIPELTTIHATIEDDQKAALRLIADSIAQMRQVANNSLIFHPLNLAILIAILSLVIRFMHSRGHEPFIIGTTCTGFIMIELVLIRYTTQNYLWEAEKVNWTWLDNSDMFVTKFGDEVIGAVIIEWVSGESRQKRKKAWRGEIKAWTVRMRYRGKGVGTGLLEEVVRESRKKGAESVEFAVDHANSLRVLPRLYNGKFDKNEKKGREMLQDLLEASPTRTRRKRGGSSG